MPRTRQVEPRKTSFVALEDNSELSTPAVDFFRLDRKALVDPVNQSAKLADQFVKQNVPFLSLANIACETQYDGRQVSIRFQTANTIGAIPLISPISGRADHGVIVRPRFQWDGLGAMLARMGWRVTPIPLKLEKFQGSEAAIPRWVLSSMILLRIGNLLRDIHRKFEMVDEIRIAPRGRIRWNEYASRSVCSARFLSIPCTFPDLRQDFHLLGTIRFCLERLIEALQSQTEHGAFVRRLVEIAMELLAMVQHVPVFVPTQLQIAAWLRKPLKSDVYLDGLQALQWTIEKRGLAGASKLEGIPWVMEMDRFFEAWIETLFQSIARTTGGLLKVGRKHETTRGIAWDPPYLGSQKSLIPDLWVQWGSTTLIVDAKYKRHFEELQTRHWGSIEAEWKKQHRNDVLQVLAYANLAESKTIISCLVYPCSPSTWTYMKVSGRLFHKAEITVRDRALHLWMTAAPIKAAVEEFSAPIISELLPVLRAEV